MNWDQALERNQARLLVIVTGLLAELGLAGDEAVERLSKPVYQYALRQLRKAESAVRRLIYVAARNIVLEPEEARPPRTRRKPSAQPKAEGEAKPRRKRHPVFNLFDALRRVGRRFRRKKRRGPEPHIHSIESFFQQKDAEIAAAQAKQHVVDDGMVDTSKLIRRCLALTEALGDIPGQAMRLARWQAKPKEERRPERWSPLRSGRPPGYRERPKHEIEEVLKDCDWLARNVMPALDDTS